MSHAAEPGGPPPPCRPAGRRPDRRRPARRPGPAGPGRRRGGPAPARADGLGRLPPGPRPPRRRGRLPGHVPRPRPPGRRGPPAGSCSATGCTASPGGRRVQGPDVAAAKRAGGRRSWPMSPTLGRRRHDWTDLRPVLDQELERLPDRLPAPLVLCDLEGLTRPEAARRLGWPDGTVASRLAAGRRKLADRLARRGIALSGGALDRHADRTRDRPRPRRPVRRDRPRLGRTSPTRPRPWRPRPRSSPNRWSEP